MSGMGNMIKEYSDMLSNGEYDSEQELCNGEGINYHDLYEDADNKDDEN